MAPPVVGDVEHDAAVAGLGDVVLERQLEPVVLVGGDDVAGVVGVDAGQGAVLDLPAGPHAVVLEVVPAVERLAVEEELPAGLLLLIGESVLRFVVGAEEADEQQCEGQAAERVRSMRFSLVCGCRERGKLTHREERRQCPGGLTRFFCPRREECSRERQEEPRVRGTGSSRSCSSMRASSRSESDGVDHAAFYQGFAKIRGDAKGRRAIRKRLLVGLAPIQVSTAAEQIGLFVGRFQPQRSEQSAITSW